MIIQKMKRKERWARDVAKIIEVSNLAAAALEKKFAKKPVEAGPFFGILAETHMESAHALAQMRIMQMLQERGYKVSVGLELSHNERDVFLEDLDAPDDESVLGSFAPLTSRTMLRFLNSRRISTVFADAAYVLKKDSYLDVRDKPTRQMIAGVESKALVKKKIYLESTMGMKVRNHFMVAQMKDHAAWEEPDFYFLICGAYHMAGVRGYYPYSESVIGILHRDVKPVLGVSFGHQSIKEKAKAHCEDGLAFSADMYYASKPEKERAWLDFAMPQLFPGENFHHRQLRPAAMSIKR